MYICALLLLEAEITANIDADIYTYTQDCILI